jgi:nitrogen fixation/metabolism regulation signal transduction histidine kinase
MGTKRVIFRRPGIYPRLGLFALLLLSLYLMSGATGNSERFSSLYLVLLIVNTLIAMTLLILIVYNLLTLIRQRKKGKMGSRLTVKLVVIFVAISVVPLTVLYFFSAHFISRGIDSWFDVKIEQALQDSLDLSRAALDIRMRELLRATQAAKTRLEDSPFESNILIMNDIRSDLAAFELLLFDRRGRVIASSIQQQGSYVGLDPQEDDSLLIRTLIPVRLKSSLIQETLYLQAIFPVSEQISSLTASVTLAFDEYKQLAFLRQPLKNSFMLSLFLVLLLSMLSAVWAAFYAARRFVSPIRALVSGTQAISAGDYSKQLSPTGKDELGTLVNSFNDMTRKIAQARDEVKRNQQLAERERIYLETVLGHLSSGVLTINADYCIRTGNMRAEQILTAPVGKLTGERIDLIADHYPHLEPFIDLLSRNITRTTQDWADQITLFAEDGRKVLMCRGAAMTSGLTGRSGFVIVFDDITGLLQAQRDAAWGEVARRLAHEIKNPLTPIQLSAERMRRKYLPQMSESDAEMLDRSTQTIIHQVDTMKEMVNAFVDYARAPQIQPVMSDLNALVIEVTDLFRLEQGKNSVILNVQPDPELPKLSIDPGRFRQVLNNLVRNALEAVAHQPQGIIDIRTQQVKSGSSTVIRLTISDNGDGLNEDIKERIFEPYVTSKTKGTGLGLAIVKKIIDEHNGLISADNSPQGGVTVSIQLPVPQASAAEIPAAPLLLGDKS